MNPLKIVWLSDFDPLGSGYQGLSTMLAEGLSQRGHDVKAIGLHYGGQEHTFSFSILPCPGAQEALAMLYNLRAMWHFDVLIVALDINLQDFLQERIQQFRSFFRYVGIMPIEADPLCMSWAMTLLQMDLPLIISQFGTEEAQKAMVLSARHIPLGVDSDFWVPAKSEEREKWRRQLFNLEPDTFTVLTVADNQERKNLWAGLEAFQRFHAQVPDSHYVLVTREQNPVGWKLRDLIMELRLSQCVTLMERGMPREDLRKVYGASDCFFLPSKAEGLGLPLLEAMAMRLPCVATDCTGMRELLSDNRGVLIPPQMIHRDPFGNGRRYWIDIDRAAQALHNIQQGNLPDIDVARSYVAGLRWSDAVDFLDIELHRIMEKYANETQEESPSPAHSVLF